MDTNAIENEFKPITLARNNALSAGHNAGAQTWTCLASLIGTCKLNAVDAAKSTEATLRKIFGQNMQRNIDTLKPWNFDG